MWEGSVANPIGHLHDQSNTNKDYHLAIPWLVWQNAEKHYLAERLLDPFLEP